MRKGHKTDKDILETGEAPFEAGLSNLSNPILSRSPHKTSIAYIRVISTLIQLEHI